jgi:hypothetical protein
VHNYFWKARPVSHMAAARPEDGERGD